VGDSRKVILMGEWLFRAEGLDRDCGAVVKDIMISFVRK